METLAVMIKELNWLKGIHFGSFFSWWKVINIGIILIKLHIYKCNLGVKVLWFKCSWGQTAELEYSINSSDYRSKILTFKVYWATNYNLRHLRTLWFDEAREE